MALTYPVSSFLTFPQRQESTRFSEGWISTFAATSQMGKNICLLLLVLLLPLSPAYAYATEKPLPPYQLMREDVEKAVGDALAEQGVAEKVEVHLLNERASVVYASRHPVQVELNNLQHDSNRYTWSANLVIMHREEVLTARPLSGRYEAMRAVPVLTERLNHEDIIQEDDIALHYMAVSKVRGDIVTKPEALLGKTPRRTIASKRPVRASELVAPHIIQKGTAVTMKYETPYMVISTIGEAIEGGGMGDMIRIRNTDSNAIVRAKVISSNEVVAGSMRGAE